MSAEPHKMIMAIVPRAESLTIVNRLVAAGHTATLLDSRSGVLRQAQVVLLIAVPQSDVDEVLAIVRDNCHSEVALDNQGASDPFALGGVPVTAELGGAVVFVWPIERMEIY
jgi:uncharacterized protein YaaQ